ncbi:MAG: YggU family protein [Phycisphaerae bacterium]|nr:YggU family protein [Phycisphaerae bacterium]
MPWIESDPGDPLASIVHLKVVPGAKRDEIAGLLGERLKVRVSAPPEGGKANKAVIALLAKALGARSKDIEIVSGATNPEKVVRVAGVGAASVVERLGMLW